MRITLNLDPDVAQNLKQKIEDENLSLNEAVNQVLRAGLKLSEAQEMFRFKVEPHACGFRAGIDQDRLNQLVDELDVEEAARKLNR
jgi:hypothetical protein